MRYVVHLRILSLRQRGGVFGFFDHLEQTADFDDILVVDIAPRDEGLVVWAKWNSEITQTLRDYKPEGDPLSDLEPETNSWKALVGLPRSAAFLGGDAAVLLTARARE